MCDCVGLDKVTLQWDHLGPWHDNVKLGYRPTGAFLKSKSFENDCTHLGHRTALIYSLGEPLWQISPLPHGRSQSSPCHRGQRAGRFVQAWQARLLLLPFLSRTDWTMLWECFQLAFRSKSGMGWGMQDNISTDYRKDII